MKLNVAISVEVPPKVLEAILARFGINATVTDEEPPSGQEDDPGYDINEYVDIEGAALMAGISKSKIYAGIKAETFPASTHKHGKKSLWSRDIVQEWKDKRDEESE